MAQIQKDVDLTPHNTFKVAAYASRFLSLDSPTTLNSLSSLTTPTEPILVLGEGSNVLFTKDFPGLVILNNLKGQKILAEDDQSVALELAAGENWHDFVMWAVENNLSGIENLALIPGTVGAAPVQNIAAYGQTAGEVIESVKGVFLTSPNTQIFLTSQDCRFFYRDSAFKHEFRDKFLITSVVFKLSKSPRFDTNYFGTASYESLKGELAKINPQYPQIPYTPQMVAQAVINLRKIKMPDWKVLGTAGSFFANPFVSKERYAQLKKEIPDLQAYPINHMLYPNPDDPVFKRSDQVKIPAGKLLDVLGWRGKIIGRVGTFERHALVVVNYGGATGQEILEFTQKMKEDVKKNFEVELEPEVNII